MLAAAAAVWLPGADRCARAAEDGTAGGLRVELRVFQTVGRTPRDETAPDKWVLGLAQIQYIEGKTAGPPGALAALTGWKTLTSEMAPVMEAPDTGSLEARVRPAQDPGKLEVLARIRTGKARSAVYLRLPAEPGARGVTRLVTGFDRPSVYIGVRIPGGPDGDAS